jgi:predicted nucleic acid-binding protein
MTAVVADASPLNYMVLIGEVEILARLYTQILVPDVVVAELRDPEAPPPVREWAVHPPTWVEIRQAPASSERLPRLDDGERAAILLAAAQPGAVLLLVDDAEGRAEAARRGIPAAGTLGVLRAAALRDLVDLPAALSRLAATSFRCPAVLLEELLAEDLQRKGRK